MKRNKPNGQISFAMIIDSQTNFLYLADTVPTKYPNFYKLFEEILKRQNIRFALLPGTKDIWAVDYMPIQCANDNFIQFKYNSLFLAHIKLINEKIDSISVTPDSALKTIKNLGIANN